MANHDQQHRTFLILTTLMAMLAIGGIHPEQLGEDFIQRPLWLMSSLIPLSLFAAWSYLRRLKQGGINNERDKLNTAIVEEMKRRVKAQILRQKDDEYESNVGKGHLAGYVIHNIYNDKKRFRCQGRECKGVVVVDLHAQSGRKQNKTIEEKFSHKFTRQDYAEIKNEMISEMGARTTSMMEGMLPLLFYVLVLPFYFIYLFNY